MWHGQTQQVFNLCGEDGDRDTACESYHNRVGYVLDDGAQSQHAQQDEKNSCHQCGNGQPLHSILLDDAIDNHDEGTCGTANLHLRTSEERDGQTGYDGGDDALLRAHTTGDAKGNGQRQRNNANNDAGHQVGYEGLLVVVLDGRQHFGLKV